MIGKIYNFVKIPNMPKYFTNKILYHHNKQIKFRGI